jgi:hypothetical protein
VQNAKLLGELEELAGVGRGKMGQISIGRRKLIGEFHGASEILLRPRKTKV